MFFPRHAAVFGLFPPGEPFTVWKIFSSLGSTGNIGQSVAIDIPNPHIMGPTGASPVRKNMTLTVLLISGPDGTTKQWNLERGCFGVFPSSPPSRVDRPNRCLRWIRCGNRGFVVNYPQGPFLLEWSVRALEPKDQLVGTDEVLIAITINIHETTMNAGGFDFSFAMIGIGEAVTNIGFPVGPPEQSNSTINRVITSILPSSSQSFATTTLGMPLPSIP